jgi:uncharacterized protein
MLKVRMLEEEKTVIVNTILSQDKDAKIYLFGSRTSMNQKGGDTDLLILSDKLKKKDLVFIEWEIFKYIDEQKIDFIISPTNITDSFIKMILDKGIPLC